MLLFDSCCLTRGLEVLSTALAFCATLSLVQAAYAQG